VIFLSLELKNIRKVFKSEGIENVAVDNFNLSIGKGELVTFLGPSGCGKTTTLRMVSGFEVPSSGRVLLEGTDITNDPPNKRDISMMFQSYALFPHLNIRENIEFGLKIKKLPKKVIKRKVDEIVELTGLKGMEERRPDEISGGQQQRVALARCIVMEPQVLLFDEPLSNLDAKLRESMRMEIRRIQKELEITSIYVTHDQIEAMSISDRIVVMNRGKIMQVGSPFEVYTHPANRFVADFIGNVNIIEATVVSRDASGIKVFCKDIGRYFVGNSGDTLSEGDKVFVVIRPEALVDKKNEEENCIEGVVEKYVFLGSHIEYDIKLVNNQVFHVLSYNPSENELPRIGKKVVLYFSSSNTWIIGN
jgi:iron(III) transport system ATP-binding protein